MAKYEVCPYCGAHLDHGESCDCQKESGRVTAVTVNTPKNKNSIFIFALYTKSEAFAKSAPKYNLGDTFAPL